MHGGGGHREAAAGEGRRLSGGHYRSGAREELAGRPWLDACVGGARHGEARRDEAGRIGLRACGCKKKVERRKKIRKKWG